MRAIHQTLAGPDKGNIYECVVTVTSTSEDDRDLHQEVGGIAQTTPNHYQRYNISNYHSDYSLNQTCLYLGPPVGEESIRRMSSPTNEWRGSWMKE